MQAQGILCYDTAIITTWLETAPQAFLGFTLEAVQAS